MKTQVEIKWDQPESFTLVPETTTDGDAIARSNEKREADKKENDKHQLFIDSMKGLF